jgi:peroxiredoxin
VSGPRPGLKLPAIALPATDGRNICLASLTGLSVVAIYPWTGRPGQPNPPDWDDIQGAHGSTPELEGFRDLTPQFAEFGVAVFGLSGQETAYQAEMAQRLGLSFPVLSDADGRFALALALPTFATGGVNYLKRLTLVIKDGIVETVFYPIDEPARHAGDVLAWLRQHAT